ncbi:MAG: TolB family protein, partial [Streptosporangiaceae bacterium]
MRRSRWSGTARNGRRGAAALAATVAAAIVLAGLGLTACGHRAGHAVGGGTDAAADPALVAISGSSAHGSSSRIELISPTTGRVAKVVAGVGTGNGFALSPDGKDVYVVGTAGPSIEIRRISVATGKASVVAEGAYPAVSPDGRYLAYATGGRYSKVAVRDLRTGRVRAIDLRSLLGNGGNFLNQGQITWLGDGNEVVAVPGISASEAAARSGAGAGAATAGSDQLPPGRQSLIVIKIRASGLTARRIVVPDPYQDPFLVISGDLSQKRAGLIARMGFAAAGTITRVSLRGDGYRARVVARLPRGVM